MRAKPWSLLLLALWLTGCARGGPAAPPAPLAAPKPPAVLRVWLTAEPASLDPALARSPAERQLAALTQEGLVALGTGGQGVLPALAESWEIAPDGLLYTFHLRPGQQLSNGRPVTAGEVKRSWERLRGPGFLAAASFLRPVQGFEEFVGGRSPALAGLVASDPLTLEVRLSYPAPFFLLALTQPAAAVVDDRNPDLPPAGAGPYLVMDWQREESVTLTGNSYYAGGRPAVNRVEFHREPDAETAWLDFRAGYLDVLPELPPDLSREAREEPRPGEVRRQALLGAWLVEFPLQGAWAEPLVREALRQAVNREELAPGAAYPLAGLVAAERLPALVAPGGSGYYRETAAETLAAAGYPAGEGLPEMLLAYPPGEEGRRLAETIAAGWRQLGLAVRLVEAKATPPAGMLRLVRWIPAYPAEAALWQDYPAGNLVAVAPLAVDWLASGGWRELEMNQLGILTLARVTPGGA